MSDMSEVAQDTGQHQAPGSSFQANTCALSAWDCASYGMVPRLVALEPSGNSQTPLQAYGIRNSAGGAPQSVV